MILVKATEGVYEYIERAFAEKGENGGFEAGSSLFTFGYTPRIALYLFDGQRYFVAVYIEFLLISVQIGGNRFG